MAQPGGVPKGLPPFYSDNAESKLKSRVGWQIMQNERRATVAIAHTREKHRSPQRVLAVVESALKHLGGIEHGFLEFGA